MKKKGEIKRKRIIIYYAFAIVLPCLILGILAFRGIKNDQALVEREQRRNLMEASQQIIRVTDNYLLSIENNFIEIIDSIPVPRTTIFTDSLLSQFIAQHQDIAGILYLSGDGLSYLLKHNLLYIPDDFSSASDVEGSRTTQNILEKGWQFEFRENDYLKALEYYQRVLPDITGKQAGGEILNTIARVQKKLNLNDEAIETYDLIWNDYPQVLIQNKIPLGAVALMEKSFLYLKKKDTISALKTACLLVSQMQKPILELYYSNYTSFLSKTDEIIYRCEGSPDKETGHWLDSIRVMKDSLIQSEKQTDYLLAFLGNSEIISYNTEPERQNNN